VRKLFRCANLRWAGLRETAAVRCSATLAQLERIDFFDVIIITII
jgi:hypothetical protein